MNPLLNSLHFTRVGIASSAYTLLAAANQDDELSQACEALAGTDFYAEAFLTQSSRDAALGQVPGHLEFVPASAAEVVATEYPLEKLAIGPGLLSPEFGQVSSIILPAVLESELDCCSGSELHLDVTVNRVQYLITMNRDGQMQSTSCYPLHQQELEEEHWSTARWLADYFSPRLRRLAFHSVKSAQAPLESNALSPKWAQ